MTTHLHQAKALYVSAANDKDSQETAFDKGGPLDTVDGRWKWWRFGKADGTREIAPSKFLHVARLSCFAGASESDTDDLDRSSSMFGKFYSKPRMSDGSTQGLKAKALYAYVASAEDPNEVTFGKGEVLDVIDNRGKWWQVGKADGTQGIAPANYLLSMNPKARTLYAYTADPEDKNEISFSQDEILDVIDKRGKWWQVRKADGTQGIASSSYLQITTLQARTLYAYKAKSEGADEVSFSRGEILDVINRRGKWWDVRKADGTYGIALSKHLRLI